MKLTEEFFSFKLCFTIYVCIMDITKCFPLTKDVCSISPSHVEPAIIVCLCFPFLRAAFMLPYIFMIPLPSGFFMNP